MPQPSDPIVDIAPGRVRGVWRDGSAAFLGIPFAQAPVGELRFAAPVPPEPWDGVRDAVEYGATAKREKPGDQTLIPEPAVPGDATLNVNVFTPAPGAPEAALPVLVYIHGGGYIEGSPASPWYDGRAFNRDGVVTVTISYRLGFDGYGHIWGAPSNRGVRDWLAALEWVQQNIAQFGGDPARVTIAGQSAGGGAVLILLGMPTAQHLFHSAWSLSGAIANVSAERARTAAAKLARLAGVLPTREGFASVPEARLFELQQAAGSPDSKDPLAGIGALLQDGLPWGPTIDGDLLSRPTIDAIRDGVGADKPLVLGTMDDEFTMVTESAKGKLRFIPASIALGRLLRDREVRRTYLAANAPQRRKGTAAVLGRYVTDQLFRMPVVRVAEARSAAVAAGAAVRDAAASSGAATRGAAVSSGAATRDAAASGTHVAKMAPDRPLDDRLSDTSVPSGLTSGAHVGNIAPASADRDHLADLHEQAGTWAYRFSWASPTRGWALHCLDVPFWFDCLDAEGVTAIAGDAPPRALAAALHGSAVEFVREGEPGWTAWSSRPGATRVFGGEASAPDVRADGYASVRALL